MQKGGIGWHAIVLKLQYKADSYYKEKNTQVMWPRG